MLGLGSYFTITREEIVCKRTGSQFLFAGLASNTVESIKSFEAVDICFVEEAQTVSEKSWSILLPTIRAANSEIWICMNPHLKSDPTYSRFVEGANLIEDCVSVRVNWYDNPYFSEESKTELEYDKKRDYDKYLNIWEGECVAHSEALVFANKFTVIVLSQTKSYGRLFMGVI